MRGAALSPWRCPINTHVDATESGSGDKPMLNAVEARILGSLVEKEATTPDAYPLTVNAIVLACNQKTAREPVMQLEADDVAQALRGLEVRGWVKSQHGGRAERYAHRVEKVLGLTRAQTALLALLMLRGPQTQHELLARSERLAEFASADDVRHALERLAAREPALVQLLSRRSGQREDRYAHRLSGEPADPAPMTAAMRDDAPVGLADRVEALEARIASLEARLAMLEGVDESDSSA
jgi:uncharacterized protein YceH (UPF0502 family)